MAEVTNHVGSPQDPHYPSCPHAHSCPHCGAPAARQPYQVYPYYPYYTRPYYPRPWDYPFGGTYQGGGNWTVS
jgi:hypothetical protein